MLLMATPLDWGNHNHNMKLGYSAASAAKFKRSAKTKTNKQATTIFVLRRGGVDRHNSESTETSSQSRVVPRRVSRLRHKACDKLLDSKQGNLNTHSHNCNTPYETGLQGMALLMSPVRIGEFTNARSKTAEQVPSIVPTRSHYQQQHQAKERRRYPEPLITSFGKPGCDEGIAF
jgi:hypothetical protein